MRERWHSCPFVLDVSILCCMFTHACVWGGGGGGGGGHTCMFNSEKGKGTRDQRKRVGETERQTEMQKQITCLLVLAAC